MAVPCHDDDDDDHDGKELPMNSLWNKENRSSKALYFICETLGTLFITPNVTRWNSFFNSAARCASFVVLKPTALKQVFSHFGVDYFRPAEEEFLLEYVKILRPIAEALDVLLQADIKTYLYRILIANSYHSENKTSQNRRSSSKALSVNVP